MQRILQRQNLRWIILGIGLFEAVIVYFHVLGIEETPFWKWAWRNGRIWPLYPAMALAGLPLALAIGAHARRIRDRYCLALVCLAVVLMQIAGLVFAYHPVDPLLPVELVEDRYCTSFWFDARAQFLQDKTAHQLWREYPGLMSTFYIHTRNKPPGLFMIYFGLFQLLGTGGHRVAFVAAGLIALGTATAAPAVYALARTLTDDSHLAFWAAVLLALVPSEIALFPQADTVYPTLVCVMTILWIKSLREPGWIYAAGLGLVTAISLLFVYHLLLLGPFLIALAILESRAAPYKLGWRATKSALIAVLTLSVFYFTFWILTAFNPITTFASALAMQKEFYQFKHYPYLKSLPYDFNNFLFGSGRMLVLIALCALLRTQRPEVSGRQIWITRICLMQIAFVGLTGFLPGETTRLWCFLLPLLVIPAAFELTRWPTRWRLLAVGMLALFLLLMVQNVELNTLSLLFLLQA